MSSSDRRYAPGPSLLELAGIVLRRRRDSLAVIQDVWRRHGDLSRLSVPWSVPRHLVVHPDQVRQVLIDHHWLYRKPAFYRSLDEYFTGPTIVTMEGEDWHARRRLAQP